jgi:PAS domain S-box-containing protein
MSGFSQSRNLGTNSNFLIFETEPAHSLQIARYLKNQGFQANCRSLTTPDEFLEAAGTGAWDIVLADCPPPLLHFEEILSICRSRLPQVPLILISGNLGEEGVADLMKQGVGDFVLRDHLARLGSSIERSLQEAAALKVRSEGEAALLESESRYRALFENARDGMAVAEEATGILLDCNPALCRLLERQREELIGRHQSFLHPPNILIDGQAPSFQEHRRNPSARALSDYLLTRSGRLIPVEIKGSHLRIKGRHIILGIFRDITERKEAEEKLREQQATFQGILDATQESIWLFDTEGRVIMANQTALKRVKDTLNRVIGKSLLHSLPSAVAYTRWASLQEAVHSREPVEFEDKRSDIYFHHTFYPVFDSEGRVTSVASFSRDITETKKAEEALKASLEEKDSLLKEVHHRVKNNLQIVSSLLGLQAGRISHPQAVEALQDTRNRVKSMALLHETLYRSGNLASINFTAYLKELCRQMLHSSIPVGSRLRIEYQVSPINLPMEQAVPCGLIVSELVSNALKHGFPENRSGRILVGLNLHIESGMVVLSVCDEGVGLPDHFDLSGGDATETLGLRLVSGLAQQLGGRLEAEVPPAGGASFRLIFPAFAKRPLEGSL